jgi:hypothetical protein
MIRKAAVVTLCLALSANAAFAACAGPREVAALKIASLQQRLMVAGLACRAGGDSYNRFVLAHRAELQRSDDDLKAYFIANGGEAGYDAYKTRLANLAAHGPATDQNAFCATAAKDFHSLTDSGDLQAVAGYEALIVGRACEAPLVAEAATPVRVVQKDDAVAADRREIPALPYAEAPPPRPQIAAVTPAATQAAPLVVVASRDDLAPPRAQDLDVPARPAGRSERYWYYRRLYHDGE